LGRSNNPFAAKLSQVAFCQRQDVRYWPKADMDGAFPSARLSPYDALS